MCIGAKKSRHPVHTLESSGTLKAVTLKGRKMPSMPAECISILRIHFYLMLMLISLYFLFCILWFQLYLIYYIYSLPYLFHYSIYCPMHASWMYFDSLHPLLSDCNAYFFISLILYLAISITSHLLHLFLAVSISLCTALFTVLYSIHCLVFYSDLIWFDLIWFVLLSISLKCEQTYGIFPLETLLR